MRSDNHWRYRTLRLIILLVCVASTMALSAEELRVPPPQGEGTWHAVWLASVAFHGAGSAFDAYTSYHQGSSEANSLLADSNGQFGSKGILLKAGVFAGDTAIQWLILRWANRRDSDLSRRLVKTFTVLNFGVGSAYYTVGLHNQGLVPHP